ncbi:hypothetical protein EWM64_g271 [Hericium alpestre]|uniref:HIT domain-containing protein n=1 Tax=Hericium alpestre TaxID=135208 RepID=A0A4Z0AAY9_9AGAM|nr:hypothetical protein EWM64_g271 [Hericium alpestre]
MSFAPKPGCPMCGIVSSASHATAHSPLSPSFPQGSKQPKVLWRDDNFTIYQEKANPVSSKGHIIIAFNLHVPSLYSLSASDLPLLVSIRDLGHRLLSSLLAPTSPNIPSSSTTPTTQDTPLQQRNSAFRIGFITSPFRDSKIPVTDHLHAHAYIMPADLCGWWRAVAFSGIAWYAIDDLIAEIREETSNNRVKSGYANRRGAPIDTVPDAAPDIEGGMRSPATPVSARSSATLAPMSNIPNLQV